MPETINTCDRPHRACRFVLDLQADNRQDLADALYNMASGIERGELSRGVSGGYSSGYIYELTENSTPTHDEYFASLKAYLERREAENGGGVLAGARETEPLSGTDASRANSSDATTRDGQGRLNGADNASPIPNSSSESLKGNPL